MNGIVVAFTSFVSGSTHEIDVPNTSAEAAEEWLRNAAGNKLHVQLLADDSLKDPSKD